MKIETSLDWEKVNTELKGQLAELSYNNDLRKMLKTIDTLVEQLSQLEVEARRTKNNTRTRAKVAEINEAITNFEKWMMIAMLQPLVWEWSLWELPPTVRNCWQHCHLALW